MNNYDLNLHSMTKLSGWLRYCQQVQENTNSIVFVIKKIRYLITARSIKENVVA